MSPEISLLEALENTRAIRRYTDEPVAEADLTRMLFAATRAPTGSNRQGFRFLVLRDGPKALEARALLGGAAREMWSAKRSQDGYDRGTGNAPDSPKARMAATMSEYVDGLETCPLIVLAAIRLHHHNLKDGSSIYPACQNLLLAARALGYGGVLTGYQTMVESGLRDVLDIPDDFALAATITIGRPQGNHGAVRRRPLDELVFEDSWGHAPAWAVDPPGTKFTSAGPPS